MIFEIRASKRRGDLALDVDIRTEAPIAALFAPSGTGKTTLLNMVAGLVRPDSGRIVVGGDTLFDAAAGVNLPPEQRRIGYVFQDRRLFPHLSVRANLLYGAREGGAFTLDQAADLLGLSSLLGRWPATLSGGEAQRAAIGRALLSSPRALLLDEPLSYLDRARREEVMGAIERLRDETRLPILYVTHDVTEIERLGAVRFDL